MEEKKFRFNDLSTDLKAHIVDKVSSTTYCSGTSTGRQEKELTRRRSCDQATSNPCVS